MKTINKNELWQRTLTSSVLICIIALAVYFSPYSPFYGFIPMLMSITVGVALWEYYQLAFKKGIRPFIMGGLVIAVIYISTLFAVSIQKLPSFFPHLVIFIGGIFTFLRFFSVHSSSLINMGGTFFGIFYIALTMGTFISINYFFIDRSVQDGRWWVFYLLAVTKMTDMGGYFAGTWLGSHSLAPTISPNKTYEGAVGGLLVALGTSFFFAWLGKEFPREASIHFSYFQAIWLGGLISVAAQIGDLAESLLKRDAGIKNSGHLPGLGGMLDLIDSLIFTAPIVYFFLLFNYSP